MSLVLSFADVMGIQCELSYYWTAALFPPLVVYERILRWTEDLGSGQFQLALSRISLS